MAEHLMLVDASGFAFRAFYSGNPRYRPSDGEPTGAVENFLRIVWRMLGRAAADQPTMGAAVFDFPGDTFRKKLDPEYKGNRDPARRVELDKQFPIMRAAADVLGLTPLEAEGFEADDVIASLAWGAHNAGIRTTIVSSDKDFAQCVVDPMVQIVDAMERRRSGEREVKAKFGVEPCMVPHVQALAGDSVDNIPGVPGVGLDIAARLVRRLGGVEKVIEGVDTIRQPSIRHHLRQENVLARLRLDLELATLRRDVPGFMAGFDFEQLRLKPVMRSHLIQMLRSLEAEGRAEYIFGLNPVLNRTVPHVRHPFAWWREELKIPNQKVDDAPQCGFYMRKYHRRGEFIPARIWREPEYDQINDVPTGRDILRCQVGATFKDPLAEWIGLCVNPIPQAEYERLMEKYAPDKPPPRKGKTDWSSHPTPSFKKRKPA